MAFELSNLLFKGKKFVVPSLNVATKTNLGLIPFLILCRDIEKLCRDVYF